MPQGKMRHVLHLSESQSKVGAFLLDDDKRTTDPPGQTAAPWIDRSLCKGPATLLCELTDKRNPVDAFQSDPV